MTEPGTRSPQVVWREVGNSQRVLRIPSTTCQTTFSVIAFPQTTPFRQTHSENLAVRNTSYGQPVGHRNGTDVPSFPDKVNNGPVILPALNMVKSQINEFSSTKPTA